ncbi:MAG: CPBP family intramembrane metalloprotease [Rhodobacteraceae bacterium]|nr:CPBP family intramembrane metalloprotease [Paracoccaceae bacterium]
MDRFWGNYAPNRRIISYLRSPGEPGLALLGGLTAYLGWSLLRQAFLAALPPETGWGEMAIGFLLNAGFFGVLTALTALLARRLHGIDPRRFLGDGRRFFSDFWRVLAAVTAAYLAFILLMGDFTGAEMRPLGPWLAFLPLAFFAIGIQTLGEEFFFRGYLHHMACAHFTRVAVWMVAPSAVFAASHVFNDTSSVFASLTYMTWVLAFGLACVDLTARTGSLGAAWGLHLAYNMFAICLFAEEGGFMSAGALFVYAPWPGGGVPDPVILLFWTLQHLIFLLVLWLAARHALKR